MGLESSERREELEGNECRLLFKPSESGMVSQAHQN